ncbi:MAG: UDP-3-O-(3-hydroxymyristoyl)glucosamine N-acyltransferase [Proteobacteria bacterium]|nr:UDP-3-O-(3-hydroxymyristoyl)glucosamine N-acyltransferase [Pseudomonadota bacterium]
MDMTLAVIAEKLGGRLSGDGHKIITGMASFDQAMESELCFADDSRYLVRLGETKAAAVLVPEEALNLSGNLIYVKNPRMAFVSLSRLFNPGPVIRDRIHPSVCVGNHVSWGKNVELRSGVVIGDKVSLGSRVLIYPNVVIGDGVILGDDVMIYPNVTILDRCVIGSRVTIHAGTVIGSDGFGFVPEGQQYTKIPHTGIVRIGDDVEIGASNTIDRGTHGETRIKNGVKTDNLVHVGHNVEVGENTLLVAQVGIAGSSVIGDHVILAGQVGVSGHLTIGNNAVIGPKAGVIKSVDAGAVLSGVPAIPHKQWMKAQIVVSQLPELKKKLGAHAKRLKELEEKGD